MEAFLAQWGLELILSIISAIIIGYLKWNSSKLKQKIEEAEKYAQGQKEKEVTTSIEVRTKPLYDELENLRAYVRDNEIKSDAMWKLVIDSYKFRLVELCKEHLHEGHMTQAQYDQLSEFYKLYTGLGGNGQAAEYYEKAKSLEIRG